MVIPDGHNKNHALLRGGAHSSQASLGLEQILVAKGSLLWCTEAVADGIPRHSSDRRPGVGDDDAILDVESADLGPSSGSCIAIGNELGNDSELRAGIDGQALSVEVGRTHAVRVEIASISVAK